MEHLVDCQGKSKALQLTIEKLIAMLEAKK
jgi:hypothetical protein